MAWYFIYAADEFAQGFQGTYKIKIDEYDSNDEAVEDAIDLSYEVMEFFHHQAIDDIAKDIVDNTIEEHPELKNELESLYDDAYEKVCNDNVYYKLYEITDEAILEVLEAYPLAGLAILEPKCFSKPEFFAENYCEEVF